MPRFPRPILAAHLTFLPDAPVARREVRSTGVHQGEQVTRCPVVVRACGASNLAAARLIASAVAQVVFGGDGPLGERTVKGQGSLPAGN